MKTRGKRKILITLAAVACALLILVGASALYLGDYYRADEDAISALAPSEDVSVTELDNGDIVFEPENASFGFIFYPGGKVEHRAYIPLMAALADRGVLCVLVEMPFNLAVFDVSAADGIKESYAHIESWYIGGHSLGGSMAASYLSGAADEYEGLVLLGSYSTADLSEEGIAVLSVFGSEDKIMNREKYEDNKKNLPARFEEIVIEGGNHSGFGAYGEQDGDGESALSSEEQIRITADGIVSLWEKYGNE